MTKQKKLIAILLAALLGVAAFFITNGATSLDVTNDDYIMRGYVERDIIQHYTGWLMYRQSHVILPLGVSDLVSYPTGGTIAFSDSIPIVSVFFGMFRDALPETFQFFGLYSLLCYVLMGISSSLLLSLFFDRILPVVVSSVLFIFSPIILERVFRHTALASHYLIIFAIYLYFKNRKEGFDFRIEYLLLCFLATSTHFYFVPIILAILFADLLHNYIKAGKLFSNLSFLILNILTVIFTAFIFGYFYRSTSPSGVLGYGYFTMNLNSLFNPISVSKIKWSYILPAFGQGLGSAEGFNYLGLGMLLSLLVIILYYILKKRIKSIFSLIKRHLPLFIVSVILTLFAVSTTVVINNNAYLRINLPIELLRLFSTFRSSGRLFWPVFYLIILFVIVSFKNILPKKILPIILTSLVVVQVADLTPAIITKRNAFSSSAGFANPVNNSFFTSNTNTYDEIYTFSDGGINLGLYFANYAVKNGIKTNEPFMARNDLSSYHKSNDEEYNRLMRNEIDDSKLYIFDNINRFFNAATFLADSVYSFRIPFENTYYYIIAPKNESLILPYDAGIVMLNDIPLTIANYTDLVWEKGVQSEHPETILFYDNTFTKSFLDNAEYIICENERIEIINKDYSDFGWVMVTLKITDGSFLVGKSLQIE